MTTREAFEQPPEYRESLRDLVMEAVQENRLESFIKSLVEAESFELRKEAVVQVLSQIISAKYPLVTAKLICRAFSLPLCAETYEELGQSIGKTRQNVESIFKGIRKSFGLTNQLRTGKSAAAREQYKLLNKQNFKQKDQEL